MSLPNNDDDKNGRPPWRDPFGPRDGAAISPIKKLTVASSNGGNDNTEEDDDDDDRTADETSIGSMSFSSDITSVAGAMGGFTTTTTTTTNSLLSTPPRLGRTLLDDSSSIQSSLSVTTSTEDDTAVLLQLRRGRNRRQLQRLGIATGITFALVVYMLIPTALLLSMILFGSVSSAFFYQLADTAVWEFHRSVLEGRGIGDYLPRGLYQILTSTSVHDVLTDPDGFFGANEHLPYLLLYLIPGLTPEQLDRYVHRLSPTYQGLLRNEQGLLGFYVNRNNHRADTNNSNGEPSSSSSSSSTLMRVVMGDERLREWQQPQPQPQGATTPRRLELPPTIPEGASWGDTHTTGSGVTAEDPAPSSRRNPEDEESRSGEGGSPVGIPATVAAIVGRAATVPNPPSPSAAGSSTELRPPSQSQLPATMRPHTTATATPPTTPHPSSDAPVEDTTVLMDALGSALANIVGDATHTVRERAQESFRDALSATVHPGRLYGASLGVTVFGLGLGAYGLATGTYDPRDLVRPIGRLLHQTIGSVGGGAGRGASSGGGGAPPFLSMPSGGLLVGSTIASGTMVLVLGLLGVGTGSNGNGNGTNISHRGDDNRPPTPKSENKEETLS